VFATFGIHHAIGMACPAMNNFSTLSHKWHDLRGKKVFEQTMCISIFSTNLSETFLTIRIIQQDTTINVHSSSCKEYTIPVRF
jgi:hypothetical protein